MSNKTINRKPRNHVAIYYKSHGKFIGPYAGTTFSKKKIVEMRAKGILADLSNYVLRSPLDLRRRVAK